MEKMQGFTIEEVGKSNMTFLFTFWGKLFPLLSVSQLSATFCIELGAHKHFLIWVSALTRVVDVRPVIIA